MPILAAFISSIATTLFGFMASIIGAVWAVRIVAATTLAGIYLACVVYYTNMISGWIGSVFSTAYGALLGLLFPPVAGTVVAGMAAYYTCIVGKRYISMLTKLAVG
jgi:uncharacterized membrane protein YqaE (UPF0057 family)